MSDWLLTHNELLGEEVHQAHGQAISVLGQSLRSVEDLVRELEREPGQGLDGPPRPGATQLAEAVVLAILIGARAYRSIACRGPVTPEQAAHLYLWLLRATGHVLPLGVLLRSAALEVLDGCGVLADLVELQRLAGVQVDERALEQGEREMALTLRARCGDQAPPPAP
jgi:hypothetical protein